MDAFRLLLSKPSFTLTRVPSGNDEVSRLPLVKNGLKLVIKELLYFLLVIVCWCVDLDNCGVLTLRLKSGKDNPLGDWLPLPQAFSLLH